ncbi:hypothetical protein AAMO2058_000146100 [Amorphochlora amoebiformis]
MVQAAVLVTFLLPLAAVSDVSWTPSGDGPLPLKKSFRDKLRKLCKMVQENPSGVQVENMENLKKQCAKLAHEDTAAELGLSNGGSGPSLLMWLVVAAGVYLYFNRGALNTLTGGGTGPRPGGASGAWRGQPTQTQKPATRLPDKELIERARAARLRRFTQNKD